VYHFLFGRGSNWASSLLAVNNNNNNNTLKHQPGLNRACLHLIASTQNSKHQAVDVSTDGATIIRPVLPFDASALNQLR
jgi:hypothetical protein